MNELIINEIQKNKNRIDICYDIKGDWKKYFNLNNNFFIEYERDVEEVPNSICIIPFIANILPIVWINDATVKIDELDKEFYECIDKVKEGYIKMFPKIEFLGNIRVKNIIDNSYVPSKEVAAFFSGGLDSFSTLIGHISEKPQLITIWGSDIELDDVEGWKNVTEDVKNVEKEFDVKHNFIKTNFRTFINEELLTDLVWERANDGWWHGFQHGVGIIGQVAPLAYIDKIGMLYIAASYTEENKAPTCASDPSIDNYVKMANCNVHHDQYDLTRMDKVKVVINYSKKTNIFPQLRVCWQSKGGKNCCHCEKCYRTIYEVLSCGVDPNKYGFEFNYKINKEARRYMMYKYTMSNIDIPFWNDIKKEFQMKKSEYINSAEYKWIDKLNPEKGNYVILKKIRRFIGKIKNKVVGR